MNLHTISSEIKQLQALIEEWKNQNEIPDIEREIALDKLKSIYASLKNRRAEASTISDNLSEMSAQPPLADTHLQGLFFEVADRREANLEPMAITPKKGPDKLEEIEIPDFPLPESRATQEDKGMSLEEAKPMLSSISSLAGLINSSAAPAYPSFGKAEDGEARTQPEEEFFEFEMAAPAPEPANPAAVPPPANVVAAPPVQPAAPAREVQPEQHKPTPTFTPKTEGKQTPIAANLKARSANNHSGAADRRLGEVIGTNHSLLNETIKPVADANLASKLQQKPIHDLGKAISFNDKFLFIRELFNGDSKAYENTIGILNRCQTLDEALIFISQNHRWDASSATANALIELLQRRYE